MLARGERRGEGTSVEYRLGDGNGLAEMFAAEPSASSTIPKTRCGTVLAEFSRSR